MNVNVAVISSKTVKMTMKLKVENLRFQKRVNFRDVNRSETNDAEVFRRFDMIKQMANIFFILPGTVRLFQIGVPKQ